MNNQLGIKLVKDSMLANRFQIELGNNLDNIQQVEKMLINWIREGVEGNSAAFPSSTPWKEGAAWGVSCISRSAVAEAAAKGGGRPPNFPSRRRLRRPRLDPQLSGCSRFTSSRSAELARGTLQERGVSLLVFCFF